MAITNEPKRVQPRLGPDPDHVPVRLIGHMGQTLATFRNRREYEVWRQLQYGRQRYDCETEGR